NCYASLTNVVTVMSIVSLLNNTFLLLLHSLPPPSSTPLPYTTLFRSDGVHRPGLTGPGDQDCLGTVQRHQGPAPPGVAVPVDHVQHHADGEQGGPAEHGHPSAVVGVDQHQRSADQRNDRGASQHPPSGDPEEGHSQHQQVELHLYPQSPVHAVGALYA